MNDSVRRPQPVRYAGSRLQAALLSCGVLGLAGLYATSATGTTPATPDIANVSTPASGLRAMDLKTEYIQDPLGVDAPHPRFGWLLESEQRGQMQTAYQVQVATSLEKLQADTGDKWDSGKVVSDNSVEVFYRGKPLASGERAYWKVRVWDRHGQASAYSAPSFLEMGLLRQSDWQGKWIGAKKGISAPLLRRKFSIDSQVRRARIYVSGLGYYELSINGRRIGDRVLDPASTYYSNDLPFKLGTRVLYATYDVTEVLQTGSNAIGVILGNGWYSSEADTSCQPPYCRTPYGDRPRLMLEMRVELADGRTLSLSSDSSWKTSAAPITYNDLAQGETYDARLEQPGWDRADFDDGTWDFAELVDAPTGVMTAELLPPSKIVATLPVVRMITPKETTFFANTYIYDFGQNFSGWARVTVSGPRGAKLVLRYGERLYPEDDTLDTRSNDTPVLGARQTDTYILKGEGTEVWEPQFTLHGFRYLAVRGFGSAPSVQKIEGRVVRSAVRSMGSFESSNELVNKIHQNIQRTFLSSFQGNLQDAAERAERMSWLGDPGFVAEDYILNYDMHGLWEKWLEDIRGGQREDGCIPVQAPLHFRSEQPDMLYPVWPSWQSTYPLLVWYLYQYYGDRHILETHYPNLKRLVGFLQAASKDDLVENEPLGDHMEPQEEGFSSSAPRHTPSALTANAYYYEHVRLVSQIAAVLGQVRESKAYGALAHRIQIAFNRRFFDRRTNQYATGSETSNALPLYLGIVPVERIPAVMKNLIDDIIVRHHTHVSTGVIGSNALVQVLPGQGKADLMYRLATQTTYPSLGHQVLMGATTVCENYECDPWASQNMMMFASLDKFFYRDLAGIYPEEAGYRRLSIRPHLIGDLRNVTASQHTVRGTIAVVWVKEDHTFDLKVSIPAGVEADIAVPTLGWRDVTIVEGTTEVFRRGHYVPGTAGLYDSRAAADAVVFGVGSGSYHFTVSDAWSGDR